MPEAALRDALRHSVLDFLCPEGVLHAELAQRMLQWRHSGYSAHNRIRSKATDVKGRQRLACYMIRRPVALEKMRYHDKSCRVIYRSKLHATLKRHDPLECSHCGATMRIIALIDDPESIDRILVHMNVWDPPPETFHCAGPDPPLPKGETIPLTYHPVPDSA